ncbi:MAG: hypothetical protein II981_02030 [Bacteroidales bacterium]|nr:hypothetical protein [Bacteroidales bacterium]
MIEQILRMVPSSMFNALPEKLELVISQKLAEVEVKDGELAAVLLIEGINGYMVNVIRLDESLNMTIVSQQTLKDFVDNVLNFVKDGNLR